MSGRMIGSAAPASIGALHGGTPAAHGGVLSAGRVGGPSAHGGLVAAGRVEIPTADRGPAAAGRVVTTTGDGGVDTGDDVELAGHQAAIGAVAVPITQDQVV